MTTDIKNKFIGTWKLDSITVKHGGHNLHPFGKHVKGILFYSEKHMSVQIMMPVHYPLTPERKASLRLEELAQTLKNAGYMGYWGTWHIRKETQTVIHKVEGSIAQPVVHKHEIRKFKFEHYKLILSTGPMYLEWERIS
jgi:hypothetical protein